MELGCTESRRIVVSSSLALLEAKYKRAARFGEYLEQHPEADNPLSDELQRSLTLYRIALTNLIKSKQAEEKPALHGV